MHIWQVDNVRLDAASSLNWALFTICWPVPCRETVWSHPNAISIVHVFLVVRDRYAELAPYLCCTKKTLQSFRCKCMCTTTAVCIMQRCDNSGKQTTCRAIGSNKMPTNLIWTRWSRLHDKKEKSFLNFYMTLFIADAVSNTQNSCKMTHVMYCAWQQLRHFCSALKASYSTFPARPNINYQHWILMFGQYCYSAV